MDASPCCALSEDAGVVEEEARVRDFWHVRRGGRRADLGMEEVVEAWSARVGGGREALELFDGGVEEVGRWFLMGGWLGSSWTLGRSLERVDLARYGCGGFPEVLLVAYLFLSSLSTTFVLVSFPPTT